MATITNLMKTRRSLAAALVGVVSVAGSVAGSLVTEAEADTPIAPVQVTAAAPTPDGRKGPTSPEAPAPTQADVPLINAERISIKVQTHASLTGEYRINADQTVSIPVLGRISIANMTPVDLERVLAEKIEKETNQKAHVTVEVAEYQPVFVNGYVTRAGSFPWKPGMTVFQAEALAGGLYRPTSNSPGASSAESDVSRIKRVTDDLKRVLASLARARAERDDIDTIQTPARLEELVGKDEAAQLIVIQTKDLETRRSVTKSQKGRLEESLSLASKELDGLREQQARINAQVELRGNNLRKLSTFNVKGVVTEQRLLEEQGRLADLEERSTNTVVAIARIQSSIINLQRDVERTIQERQLAINAEVAKLERDSAQMEIELGAAHSADGSAAGTTYRVGNSELRRVVTYEVMRKIAGEERLLRFNRFSELKPGDILLITLQDALQTEAASQ